jgi:hypothetical protein
MDSIGRGQIVANGSQTSGPNHAFLLHRIAIPFY